MYGFTRMTGTSPKCASQEGVRPMMRDLQPMAL